MPRVKPDLTSIKGEADLPYQNTFLNLYETEIATPNLFPSTSFTEETSKEKQGY